ncbi:MAG TPA: hypothetical protein PKW05_11005 [Anaerolineae bacterium]|nr:hypothetical protein [Anaerolineae bacterium]
MKGNLWRVLAGLLIILVGILLLVQQLGKIDLSGDFWGIAFMLGGGVIFLTLWLSERAQWWPLIPGGILASWGVAALLGKLGLSATLVSLVGMFGSAAGFLAIYWMDRKENWWALIPAGVFVLVGIASVIGTAVGEDWTGSFVLWGIAAVFAVLYLRDRSQFWPLIPAGVLAVVGFGVSPLATSAWFLFPALLIVAGVLLVVRTLFRRT